MPEESQQASWPALLLADPSIEITTRERRKLSSIGPSLPPGSRVFIAGLATDTIGQMVDTAIEIRRVGHRAVPHIVARNLASERDLDERLQRLAEEAGVSAALVVGGDTTKPAGPYDSSLALLRTGSFRKHGFRDIFLGCYPEGHPRIAASTLRTALAEKLSASAAAGHRPHLISQLCFDAATIVRFAKGLREAGIETPLHVGVAGPAKTASLLKYAALCGVGPSLRALKERQGMTRSLLAGITPDTVLAPLAQHMAGDSSLGLASAHFFAFGAVQGTADWIEANRPACQDPRAGAGAAASPSHMIADTLHA